MRFHIIILALLLGACGSKVDSLQPKAEEVIENITCPQSQSRLYDVLYASLTDLENVPTEKELQNLFQKVLSQRTDLQIDERELLKLVSEFYQILLQVPSEDKAQLLEKLTALEIGDKSTDEAKLSQQKLKQFQEKWDYFRAQQNESCPLSPGLTPTPGSASPGNIVYGARKALVTAYQSCEVLEKPVMTLKTPAVKGIERVGTHSDGKGGKRVIRDLKSVQQTHYYLQTKDQSSSCMDISKKPLIYDYGGKPAVTSEANSSLDFFRNSGSGSTALGIDCSGYVFSAIAAGGLKIHPDKKMKAIHSHGIGARMYMDPVANGMPCFEKVKMGPIGTLKSGDIAAIAGHVVLIDSVGSDPFGLARAKTASQCSSLDVSGFDFVILQSSPSKNGIGINRYEASDYLQDTGGTMLSGFEKYAIEACKAKFKKQDVQIKVSGLQIVRHKRTASCMDKPIALVGESCAATCRSLVSNAMPARSFERPESSH